ncbi:hypothetical protein QMK33_11805 [Hymenobacter sp. H14-R3]|uniref:hypothetical protein n=1 Tax=Hymenobacter sp. H14-R3 TaxID=3046308 RepID=UPI0024B912DC|nr:hypothetical protein [Hymenobacter sp. H14-R3]MDJ0365838.1 hypothetical protein [Hymenobacter sp. H14-R3]
MPKLIDYPRTGYTGAWEVAEVVDDTGGKCALETSARKLNRKVSGSFKAIVGSAVKFGLLTSKREMLTTTTLFRRIKHAYDKQEELLFHREAFLNPPLFTQLCRKFRSRELPVAMLDVLLMREFDVEEINAQSVAKAFTDGARMVGLLNEDNILADIDQLAAQQPPRRELASPALAPNIFRQNPNPAVPPEELSDEREEDDKSEKSGTSNTATSEKNAPELPESAGPVASKAPATTPSGRISSLPPARPAPAATADAIAHLFGLTSEPAKHTPEATTVPSRPEAVVQPAKLPMAPQISLNQPSAPTIPNADTKTSTGLKSFTIHLAGPGMQTQLEVTDVEDLALVRALLDKIERQLRK